MVSDVEQPIYTNILMKKDFIYKKEVCKRKRFLQLKTFIGF